MGLGALAAGAFAFAIYLRQMLALAAGYDVAATVAAGSFAAVGVGAALVAIIGERAGRKLSAALALHAVLFGVAALVAAAGVARLTFGVGGAASPAGAWLVLALYAFGSAAPFVFVGFVTALVFRAYAAEPNKVYAVFLGGAAFGVVLAASAFALGGENAALALVAVLAAAAAVGFCYNLPKLRLVAPAALTIVAVVMPFAAPTLFDIASGPASFLQSSGNVVTAKSWSGGARAELSSPAGAGSAPQEYFGAPLPPHEWLTLNGRRAAPVLKDGAALAAAASRKYAPALACRIKAPGRALVVGAPFDARAVIALGGANVELVAPPAAVKIIKDKALARDLWAGGAVQLYGGQGRAFLRRAEGAYDLVLISPSLTFGPGEGSQAFRPDYLATVNALREYYRRLSPQGILSFTAPATDPPTAGMRFAAAAYDAFHAEGELQPANNVVVFRRAGAVTVIAKKGGFGDLEAEGLMALADDGFEPLYIAAKPLAKGAGDNAYSSYFRAADKEEFYRRYPYEVRPSTDDRPYGRRFESRPDSALSPGGTGRVFGVAAVGGQLTITIIFLLIPLYYFKRRHVRAGGKAAFALYFLLFGLLFAAFTTSLRAKVAFYLGGGAWQEPAAAAIFFGVAAAGALLSGRLSARRRWLPFAATVGAAILYFALYDGLFAASAAWPVLVRLYAAVVLVGLVGFFAGALAPLGFVTAAGREPAILPWAWAALIFAYALGTVGTPLVAMAWGFRVTTVIAALLCVGAWAAFAWAGRSQLPPVADAGPAE